MNFAYVFGLNNSSRAHQEHIKSTSTAHLRSPPQGILKLWSCRIWYQVLRYTGYTQKNGAVSKG